MTPKSAKAVLLPVNMGNYGQNSFPVEAIFAKLRDHSEKSVQFIAHHWRRSGNFVFIDSGHTARQMALETGETMTGLQCLIRRFSDLEQVDQATPRQAKTTRRGAVVLPTSTGIKKLIHLALSQDVVKTARKIGKIDARVKILAWPTPQDVLCVYDRPEQGGNVGQVTNGVLAVIQRSHPDIYGTGRALSVIRDLLENRYLRYG